MSLKSLMLLAVVWPICAHNITPEIYPILSQDPQKKVRSVPTVKMGGFLELDTFFDTRQTVRNSDGTAALYPVQPVCDANHCDAAARGLFGMSPGLSRFSLRLYDWAVGRAEMTGFAEIDFEGHFDYTVGLPELRHAYLNAAWPSVSVLVGLYFHPLTVFGCKPNVIAYNGGIPESPYSRNPQIRVTYTHEGLSLIGSLFSQFGSFFFSGPLPAVYDNDYIMNSMTPGVTMGVEWRTDRPKAGPAMVGCVACVTRLMPSLITTTTGQTSTFYATDETVASWVGAVYGSAHVNDVHGMTQFVLGQNGTPFYNLGGYAACSYNQATGHCTYTNVNYWAYWLDLEYLKYRTLQPGLFLGWSKSLGARTPIYLNPETGQPIFYGLSRDLDFVWRVMPRFYSEFNKITLGIEFDYTRAWYGKMDRCARHRCTSPVDNFRVQAIVRYDF